VTVFCSSAEKPAPLAVLEVSQLGEHQQPHCCRCTPLTLTLRSAEGTYLTVGDWDLLYPLILTLRSAEGTYLTVGDWDLLYPLILTLRSAEGTYLTVGDWDLLYFLHINS
jgi:hypothetical protein